MKKIVIFLSIILVASITTISCSKSADECHPTFDAVPSAEILLLEDYLTKNNITATKDDRGFYYIINQQGTGDMPSVCSRVMVSYKGTLTDGVVFDEKKNIDFQLTSLIKGWQAGIPLLKKGGSITLFIPPSLGYGDKAQSKIPANSMLIFNIDLVKVY
jgi:FKBP-type peptidyl-prolyl cis-trans isomerase FkpA